MADDARISTALPRHPKTVKLQRRLQERGCWALVCLFLWVADNRHDGDLASMTDEDIEIAASWTGEPGALTVALAEVGFLDGESGRRKIHDWPEHNPWAATRGQRVERAKRAAAVRWVNKPDAESMLVASAAHAGRMPKDAGSNAHHSTPPNPTTPQRSSGFNSTEVAQVICQQNGWSGQQIRWTMKDAIEYQAKRMPESSLEEIGEWLVNAYREYERTAGKFKVGPQKFFAEARYESLSTSADNGSSAPLPRDWEPASAKRARDLAEEAVQRGVTA